MSKPLLVMGLSDSNDRKNQEDGTSTVYLALYQLPVESASGKQNSPECYSQGSLVLSPARRPNRSIDLYKMMILITRQIDGRWTAPEVATFSSPAMKVI